MKLSVLKSLMINFALSLELSIYANNVSANPYHFVSIEKLIEQEIGRIIIPQIYKKLALEVTITPLPGKRAQLEVASGHKDGEIMRIWTYGDETPSTIRVPTPYYYLETMPFVKKASGIVIHNKDDLKQYKLAKVRGVKHTNNITKGLSKVYEISSTHQLMQFIRNGRADVALTNTIDGKLVLQKLGYNNIIPMEKPLATLKLYHYIHQDHKHLVPLVDTVLKEMTQSGELRSLIEHAEKKVLQRLVTIENND